MKHNFTINQKLLWIVNDFDGRTVTQATIIEVHSDHCIALTDNDMRLWIDSDNEMEFFDLQLQESIHGIRF